MMNNRAINLTALSIDKPKAENLSSGMLLVVNSLTGNLETFYLSLLV